MLRKLIGSAAAAMILVLAPGSAHAASGSLTDTDDADVSARYDIRTLAVTNGSTTVTGKLSIKDVQNTGMVSLIALGGEKPGWSVAVKKTSSGMKKVYMKGLNVKACSGVKVAWSASNNVVKISVPQKCYGTGVPNQWTFMAATYTMKGATKDTTSLLTVSKG